MGLIVNYLVNKMHELEHRVARLEALVKKLMKGTVVEPEPVGDAIALKIRDALLNIEHVMCNRDLMRTVDIAAVMASLSNERVFSGFDPYDETSMDKQTKMITRKLKLIPEFKSLVMTSYYSVDDDDERDRGNRRFNQSVWVIRNHDKYKALTVTQRCNEYKAQRERVAVEYRNRCDELGWNKEDHPTYPWFFPTDRGPADKPSFM